MKALKRINNFTGEEDVERWIGKFELAIEIDGKEDKEAQVLCMFLADSAYDVYSNLSDADKRDAAAIKAALRNAFGLRRIDAWRVVLGKKICIGESLDVAGEEIRKNFKIVCEGGSAAEYIPGVLLLSSLPVNIREQVVLQIGNELTYSNVLGAAKKIWPGRTDNSVCAGLNFQPKAFEMSDCNASNFPRRSPPPRCSGCKRIGHIKRDCNTVCYKCKQIGHTSRNCCSSAVPLNGVEGTTPAESVVPHSEQSLLQPRLLHQQH